MEFSTLRRFWVAVESVVGLLATFVIGFCPTIVLFFGSLLPLADKKWGLAFLSFSGCVLSGWLAGRVAKLASRVLERTGTLWGDDREAADAVAHTQDEYFRIEEPVPEFLSPPLALAMAQELPALPMFARGFLSLWWLAHFSLAVVAGHFSSRAVDNMFDRPSAVTVFVIGLTMHLAFLFAANLYLLLAVAVLSPNQRLWQSLWDYRFLIDLVLALGSTVVPQIA